MPGPYTTTGNPTGNTGGSAGPLIAAGLSTVGDITTQVLSNRMRRQLEQQAREWNLQQWHLQNRYNHPIEQMARLRAAGLNPNLIYGSSPGSAVGNAGAIHPGKAPEYKLTDPIGPGANLFMDTKVKQAQSNNLQSISNLNNMKAITELENSRIRGYDRKIMDETFKDQILGVKYDVRSKFHEQMKKMLETRILAKNEKAIVATAVAKAREAKHTAQTAEYISDVQALNSILAGYAIRPGDPYWYRAIGLAIGLSDKQEILKEYKKLINKNKQK